MNSTDPNKTLVMSITNWILTGFAALFMFISILYLVLVFKFRNVNKGLQLAVYVQKKLNMILSLKNIFRIKKMFTKNKKKDKKSNEIFMFDNAQNSSMHTIWLSLQIFNLMFYIFDELNLCICLRNMSNVEVESWKNIINVDFENINIEINECKNPNLPVTNPSYATATYYALDVSKSSIWNYIVTILFAGIFGSAITNLIK